MRASWKSYRCIFKQAATTSRGALRDKISYFLALRSEDGAWGLGECGPLPGLSLDHRPDLPSQLDRLCAAINADRTVEPSDWVDFPALRFALEMARLGIWAGDGIPFPSAFTQGLGNLPINGLIWMADKRSMRAQIRDKLSQGFRCIKLKIGALDFAAEYELLRELRREYGPGEVEIRVDANGAFAPHQALERLQRLAELQLHSIEQPIAPGQIEHMAALAAVSPLAIALDEELIGVHQQVDQVRLLDEVRPRYLILKPSLLGGFEACQQWIALAEARAIGWWVTSALESNLGLNLLAQWTATLDNPMPQGLGTGQLYRNNLPSPLHIRGGNLYFDPAFDARQYQTFFEHV